ncbi:MAG: glutaredoxin [Planctomycetia bacterium]|nr:glutaredoxin [Planctomycetia bacterium]
MGIRIEVFSSPGCGKCGKAKEVLRKQVDEIGADQIEWREVNILDEMDYAVQLGVLSTPAIAIDGTLVFSGLPSAKKLRRTLDKYLAVNVPGVQA